MHGSAYSKGYTQLTSYKELQRDPKYYEPLEAEYTYSLCIKKSNSSWTLNNQFSTWDEQGWAIKKVTKSTK